MDEELKRITVSLPEDLLEKFEKFRKDLDMSRSDSIRKAMQSYMISEEEHSDVSKKITGCITLIMAHEHFEIKEYSHDNNNHKHDHDHDHDHDHEHDHSHDDKHDHDFKSTSTYANIHQTDLLINNEIQHHFRDVIISTTHFHLEYEKCLEVIAVSGAYERVIQLKKDLQKLKSVLSIKILIVEN